MVTRRIVLINSLGIVASTFFHLNPSAKENNIHLLKAMASKTNLLEDPSALTNVWAYDGMVPGPIIRTKKGEEITIEFINLLDQPTSIHWHGIRIDNAMDGVSHLTQQPVKPGESFTYRFTPPDAGSYWYHPHNRSWEQLARGLYGALIVEGDESEPNVRDYTIIADDWRLENDGSLHEASLGAMHDWSHAGRLGNILTLNGKPYERLNVPSNERVRLRFINTANARIMRFAIDGLDNWLVALDGQAVPPTLLGKEGVMLAPAQRADLIVDVKGDPGEEFAIVETSGEENLVAGYLVCDEINSPEQSFSDKPIPLRSNKISEPHLKSAQVLELAMSGGAMRFLSSGMYRGEKYDGRELATKHKQVWSFNGVSGMSEEPFFKTNRGETIELKLINETAWPHSIHLHGHHFRILSRRIRGKEAPKLLPEYEIQSWRDTVLLERDEIVKIAFVADNPGKWMLHCHMLEHQASGMGTWFEVI